MSDLPYLRIPADNPPGFPAHWSVPGTAPGTPFGLLIRRIAKLDHEAAMKAFSDFINDQSLNQKQIAFVHKIIHHIEQNGYMESVALLTKPPFDKSLSFTKLFDKKTQAALMKSINQIKENAVTVVA